MRPLLTIITFIFWPLMSFAQDAGSQRGLDAWVKDFRDRALSQGIDAEVFDTAMVDVAFDPQTVQRDRNQSEFTKTLWDYLDTAASDLRVRNGRAAMDKYADTFARIEVEYGVPAEIVAAIWGLESSFGAFLGSDPVLDGLATLAYDGRRGDFFEEQLIAALGILQAGDTTAGAMTGSWAGAMGHTQFMPTSFRDHAVDYNGDGKRDIWGDDPTDALASTAAYLRANGWVTGQPWGVEVRLPDDFDYMDARRDNAQRPGVWAQQGVVAVDGAPIADDGPATLLLPGGAQGAAFLIFDNFAVLETYNTADAYVIGVGHLADRLAGGGPISADWPRGDRALSYPERIELQERLIAAGFDTEKVDGLIGPLTINAIRAYQQAEGLVPDGYAPPALLDRLRLR